jgi:hypothetical protein
MKRQYLFFLVVPLLIREARIKGLAIRENNEQDIGRPGGRTIET